MESKRTSVFENGLIWFGAAVSIAEILTGTYYAPMGFKDGFTAILVGHIIGFALLYLAGLIGARSGRTAMETVKLSFGDKGGLLFAGLNFLQLVGWTAIMIYDAALSTSSIFTLPHAFWAILTGGLIILWIYIGITNLGKVNTISMALLFILTLVLSRYIFSSNLGSIAPTNEAMSFGAAVELAVAMPLSWLPLISDYTSTAAEGRKSTFVSALIYSIISIWMYVIGMGGAMLTGQYDLASIFGITSLGNLAVVIIILSTVTTTFLDAYSAGLSFKSIKLDADDRKVGIIVSAIGILGAIIFPMDDITNFLYLIGSVFAPMIAIQLVDYFILKDKAEPTAYNKINLIAWVIGFIIYRLTLNMDFILGASLLNIFITGLITYILNKFMANKR